MKEINNITIKEIRKAFKEKLGLKFEYYNDLNAAKTVRRIKITGVYDIAFKYDGVTPIGDNNKLLHSINHIQNMNDYVLFLQKELGIKGIVTQQDKWGFNQIIFRIKN